MTKQELNEAKQKLIDNGWSYLFTSLNDACLSEDHGLCFNRDGEKFYLNSKSYKELPL